MSKVLPEISKQTCSEDILGVIEKNFNMITPVWVPAQTSWMNALYRTFHDYDKFMIIMHLLMRTFDFYSKNFVKLDYEEYFNQNKVEVETINVLEISNSLNIPKETARRKINELEELGAIKRIKKKIIIDRNTWPSIKPQKTMERMSRFLSTLSKIAFKEGLISEPISTENLMETTKEYFSFVWKLYYEMQMPMLLGFKKVYGDLESFHIHGICLSNHALNSKKNDNSEMSKEFYLDKYFFNDKKDFSGINAMSISDITGIPRATVIRKLNNLIEGKFLKIDNKKRYFVTGTHRKKLLNVQQITFNNLSKLASRIYNLCLTK
jgi:DNA-binding transcriptional regulator YhcF (GntR family)